MVGTKVRARGAGAPSWLWIVAALVVIILLAWWLWPSEPAMETEIEAEPGAEVVYPDDGDVDLPLPMTVPEPDAVVVREPEPVPEVVVTPPEGPITDLTLLLGDPDPALAGREVNLTDQPVQSLAGDAAFWIGPSEDRRVYVVITEERTPNTPIEGEVDVNPGDVVMVRGTVRSDPAALEGAAVGTETDPLPAGVTLFILAETVETESAPQQEQP